MKCGPREQKLTNLMNTKTPSIKIVILSLQDQPIDWKMSQSLYITLVWVLIILNSHVQITTKPTLVI